MCVFSQGNAGVSRLLAYLVFRLYIYIYTSRVQILAVLSLRLFRFGVNFCMLFTRRVR